MRNARMPALAIPFDANRLDRLMDEAGIDVLLATSKHNVQYLLGGHRACFFDYMDAIGAEPLSADRGLSEGQARQGRATSATGSKTFQHEVKPFWTPEVQTNSSGALAT